MKKFVSILSAFAICAAGMAITAGSAFAAVDASALADGTYNIDAESDNKMFKVINCDVTVKDGKLTAAVTLSGTGYGRLFVGTGEQAAKAAETEFIPFTENAEGKYVYTLPIAALDEPISVAAWSTKKSEWYDRQLTFKSDKLPPDAYKAASDPTASEPGGTSSSAPDLDIAPAPSDDDMTDNPDSGFAGFAGIVIAAAAVAVVSARRKH